MIEPLRFALTLRCSAQHAFDTWTRMSLWWPKGHSPSGQLAAVVFEGHPNGRIFERTHSGDEIDWGVVTLWAPPRRLGYLWHIGKGPEDATDVTITFDENDDGSTHVEIVHSGWERLANGQSWRDANAGGWNAILPSFTSEANADPSC